MKRKLKIIIYFDNFVNKTMKNIILTALLTFISFSISAQYSKLELGIESGANAGLYIGNPYTKFNPKIGILFGGSIQYNINKTLSLRSGLCFEKLGYYSIINVNGQSGNALGTAKFHSDLYYYRLPLLLHANFGNKTKLFINAGVNISTLSKAHYYVNSEIMQKELIIKGNYKVNTFGLILGTGLSTSLNDKINSSLELRYNYTQNNINALSFILGVGYKF